MAWNEGPNRDPWSQGPGGGKPGGGGGPPDLDELLKRLKARFGGGGSSNGGASRGSSGGGVPPTTVGLAIAVVAVIWLFTGLYVIDEQERGVVLRFGEYNRTAMPGIGWRAPWPIESIERIFDVGRGRNNTATLFQKATNQFPRILLIVECERDTFMRH